MLRIGAVCAAVQRWDRGPPPARAARDWPVVASAVGQVWRARCAPVDERPDPSNNRKLADDAFRKGDYDGAERYYRAAGSDSWAEERLRYVQTARENPEVAKRIRTGVQQLASGPNAVPPDESQIKELIDGSKGAHPISADARNQLIAMGLFLASIYQAWQASVDDDEEDDRLLSRIGRAIRKWIRPD